MAFTDIESTGVLYDVSDVNAGTGNYDSFLRLQKHGTEEGFNTDDAHEADNKDGIWTHSIKFSAMQVVTVGGVDYYEIRLDLNEGNAAGDPPITLSDLRFFYSGTPATGTDFDNDFVNLHEVFDLAGSLSLLDVHSGSGSDDYIFRVPTSLFPDKTGYFTLYSEFTGADGGFEEWRVLANEIGDDGLPAIHLEKTANPTHFDEGTPTNVTFTYVLTSQSSNTDPLHLVSFIDDNATPGDTSDDINLLTGASGTNLGIYYVSGDTNGDGLLQNTETWTFSVTVNGLDFNAGTTRTNIAQVFAQDDELNTVDDSDDAVVTADDVLPAITLVKEANHTTILEGTPTDITYSYTLTSQSAVTDPLTITALVDDNATPGDTSDDINLLSGASGTDLGIYYVSGDTNGDGLLQNTETWLFNYTVNDVVLNAGETRTNVAAVTAHDDEDNPATDDDDAVVTGQDVLPAINIEKVASPTEVQAGVSTSVTFTYSLTNTSPSPLDPLTLTSLIDDNGTPGDTSDDVNLLDGTHFVGGDTSGDGFLDKGETWTFSYTTNVTLMPGETRTNIVTVDAHDDENNPVSDNDDAVVTAFNLGRTPGFWKNNGSLLWDGNVNTFPKAGGLGIVLPGHDLAADNPVHDTDGNGSNDGVTRTDMLMVGDWNHNGVADNGENVLVITRIDALKLVDASQKQLQDGRWMLARDVVASWLNFLGGSFTGSATDPNSARHYLDEATAWLRQTTNGDHVLTVAELGSGAVKTNTSAWGTGFNFNGTAGVQNDVPPTGDTLGAGVSLDILGGGAIHSGLDHYNNFGFI